MEIPFGRGILRLPTLNDVFLEITGEKELRSLGGGITCCILMKYDVKSKAA